MDKKMKTLIFVNFGLLIALAVGGFWLYRNSNSQFNFLAEQIGVSKQAIEARFATSLLPQKGEEENIAEALKPADVADKLGFQGIILSIDKEKNIIKAEGRLEYAYVSAEEAAKVGPMPSDKFTKEFFINKDTKIEKREILAGKPKPVQILSISDLKENDAVSVKVGDVKSLTNEASGPIIAKSIAVFSFPTEPVIKK